jgi:hypothetical protein
MITCNAELDQVQLAALIVQDRDRLIGRCHRLNDARGGSWGSTAKFA